MRIHRNARTTPRTRKVLVLRVLSGGWPVSRVARAMELSRTTVYKWVKRFLSEGEAGLEDRRPVPGRVWNRLPALAVSFIRRLRRQRWSGSTIARTLGLAHSTVCGILRRIGLNRWRSVCPPEPVVRYERERTGDLLHLDVKKLGRFRAPGHRVLADKRHRSRGVGWDFVHVCVDDASRTAYAEVLEDEKGPTAVGFLRRAVGWYRRKGVEVKEVMTDNGSNFISGVFREACVEGGLRHIRTRPYRPETNGKAERFIQTMLREWAYGRPYSNSATRARALGPWLEYYNHQRPHGSLKGRAPYQRLREDL